MSSLLQQLFDFERPETSGDRLFYRGFEGAVMLATTVLSWYWGLYAMKIAHVASPLGLARFLDVSFVYEHDLTLWIAAVVSICCFAGWMRVAPRVAYPLALLLFHLQYVSRFSLGKTAHGANFVGMSLLGITLAILFFQDPLHQRRFALGYLYFFLGLAYVLAASSKLVGTGLAWSSGDHLWSWIRERHVDLLATNGEHSLNVLQRIALNDYALSTAFLAAGLLTEFAGFLMWFRRTRTWIMLALVGLHLGVSLILEIQFPLYIAELLLLALPWPQWIDLVRDAVYARSTTTLPEMRTHY